MFNHNDPEPSFGIVSPGVLDIPKECRECPQIRLLQEQFDLALLDKEEITNFSQDAMGGLPEEVHNKVKSYLSTISDLDEALVDNEISEAYKEIFEDLAHALNNMDEIMSGIVRTIYLLTGSCDGALKMRAPKGNNTYTATICTSVTAPSECITEVDIKRTRK